MKITDVDCLTLPTMVALWATLNDLLSNDDPDTDNGDHQMLRLLANEIVSRIADLPSRTLKGLES